jgi:pimeloyl-ACP methyl ester carboxylesterase
MFSPLELVRNLVHMPWAPIPEGRMLELPGRGSTFVTDTPGPRPDSPTVLLLHAVGTTGLLAWYPSIPALAKRYRVVTMDQRWHGRGIQSETFSLRDCADDAAAVVEELRLGQVIVVGYSMGSIVAQRMWRQHPDKVSGLVLGATTDRFQSTMSERLFHLTMAQSMGALRGLSRSRTAVAAARAATRVFDFDASDIHDWALAEFRSTSPWAVGQAVAALGRHHSRPWLARIDVPTAVIVTARDRVIPPQRQIALARRIPGATIHDIPAGHAAVVLEAEHFVPALVEACATVNARARDMARWQRA